MMPQPADRWPEADCCTFSGPDENCRCGPNERVLRAYLRAEITAPMTPSQRTWCTARVRAVKGQDWAGTVGMEDQDLARAVLMAWTAEALDFAAR